MLNVYFVGFCLRCTPLNTVAQKPIPLRLSAHIFKTPETIYIIFGTLQCRFVLNICKLYIGQLYVTKWHQNQNSSCRLSPDRASLCMKLLNLKLREFHWAKRRWSVPKTVQIFRAFRWCEQSNVLASFSGGHTAVQQRMRFYQMLLDERVTSFMYHVMLSL